VSKIHVKRYPQKPEEPQPEAFENRADFEEAQNGYYAQYADYAEASEELEQLFLDGKAKPVVTVSNNEVISGYVMLPENEAQASVNEVNIVQKLEKQDMRNREIAVEKIVDDTKKLIRDTEIPLTDFTEFEDKLLYFAMLEDLKSEHFTLFGEAPQNKWHLTDEDRITIINNLTEEQKTIIRRDYLVKHLSDTIGTAKKSFLMLEFARLHFPEVLAETETKYNEVYMKRHERIVGKLTALKNEVQEVA
jgi:ParB family chromosome partitioning protein